MYEDYLQNTTHEDVLRVIKQYTSLLLNISSGVDGRVNVAKGKTSREDCVILNDAREVIVALCESINFDNTLNEETLEANISEFDTCVREDVLDSLHEGNRDDEGYAALADDEWKSMMTAAEDNDVSYREVVTHLAKGGS